MRQKEVFVILGQILPFQPPDNPENQNFKIEIITCRYYHFTHLYHTWHHFLSFLDRFCSFTHPTPRPSPSLPPLPPLPLSNNSKSQNFEKMKKLAGNIIILDRCTINDNYMMYGSWDMEHVRQNFLPFWTILYPFIYPLTTWKTKILKNWKKHQEISSFCSHFTMVYQKSWSYSILFLIYGT